MAIRKTVIKRYESQAWVDNYPVTAWAYIENIPSTFPPSAHTHNYAGSSSAGGDANNAVKLNGQAASYYLNYNNFTNTPTIPTKTSQLTNDSGYLTSSTLTGDVVIDALGYTPGTSNFTGYTSSNKLSASYISGLATVATSGSYSDLSNKPTIPTKSSWNYDDRYVRYDTNSQGLNATQKANARTNIGAGTSNFSGSYNDLTNKPTIPTKVSQLTNDSGYITGITSSMVTTALGYTPYNSSNPNGYTSNTGTVTSVTIKMNGSNVGTITTSGTIDLGTVLTSKPSYNFSEIGAGNATIGDGANTLFFRTNATWASAIYHQTNADEAVVFLNKAINPSNNYTTSWIFAYGDPASRPVWNTLTPALQIKGQCVVINKLLDSRIGGSYNLEVNGTANATTLYENGTSLASKYLGVSAKAADSSKLNGQAASYYLNYNNLSNKPTIYTDCVRYVSQSLTDAQKTQARSNIGAGTSNFTGYTSSNQLSTLYIDYEGDTLYDIIDDLYGLANSKYSKPSGGIPASDLAQSYYLASNPNGYTTNKGTVTSVSVKINGIVKGTVTTSGIIDLGTIGGGCVEIGFVGYLYFNDDRNTPVWFEISAAGYGLSEGLYIIAPEDSYPGFKTDNARYWQGAISRLSATEGSFKLWKTRGDSCGYVQFTYSSLWSATITASDCAADYGKFVIYKVMNVDEP